MWSLIPWRTLLKLALPFIREFFIGKFNAKNYFAKHPVITFNVVAITLLTVANLFLAEQAIYHVLKSNEYCEKIIQLEQVIKKNEHKIESPVKAPSRTSDEGSKEKEVVLVPTTPKPDPIHLHPVNLKAVVHTVPPPKVPDPIPTHPTPKVAMTYNHKYLNERLKQIDEVE